MLAFKDQGKWLIDDLSLWRSLWSLYVIGQTIIFFLFIFYIYMDIITLTTERQGCVRNFCCILQKKIAIFSRVYQVRFAVLVYVYFV